VAYASFLGDVDEAQLAGLSQQIFEQAGSPVSAGGRRIQQFADRLNVRPHQIDVQIAVFVVVETAPRRSMASGM